MGEVYRVAVKVLPEKFSRDSERLRRFEQEARAAGILNHPNVLAFTTLAAKPVRHMSFRNYSKAKLCATP